MENKSLMTIPGQGGSKVPAGDISSICSIINSTSSIVGSVCDMAKSFKESEVQMMKIQAWADVQNNKIQLAQENMCKRWAFGMAMLQMAFANDNISGDQIVSMVTAFLESSIPSPQ